ncbi:hypothetical protein, partial [uncultured Winogradskyella sp.]|uniref:hypothetical protein n=1 Tax=uncultured Winogradskyella sp. TaxID=395353 RepID=UPI0025D2AF87
MIRKNSWIVALMVLTLSCNKDDEPVVENKQGYNMLLIGNSFFKPYAEKLDDIAELLNLKIIVVYLLLVEEIMEDLLIFGMTQIVMHTYKSKQLLIKGILIF